jgi:hypothetical protein
VSAHLLIHTGTSTPRLVINVTLTPHFNNPMETASPILNVPVLVWSGLMMTNVSVTLRLSSGLVETDVSNLVMKSVIEKSIWLERISVSLKTPVINKLE